MSLVTTGDLLAEAVARDGVVPAINAIALEHAEAIVAAAAEAGRGVIVQFSENAIAFHGGDPQPLLIAVSALAEAADAPIALHLDHVEDPGLVERAVRTAGRTGLSSIMVDRSTLPDEQNVRETAEATERIHAAGLLVEAELGAIGGKGDAHTPGVRTDPGEAADFVARTGVDALAVAVGSEHRMRSATASLDLPLIERLAAAVAVPLVLHGSSGVPEETLAAAVRAGIRKVNVGTALQVAGTDALRATLAGDPGSFDPRPALAASRAAMQDVVARVLATLP